MGRLLWHDEMISLMKVGQLWGHSCFRMETRTRFSLFRRVRWFLRLSSVLEVWMMKLTTKLRIPAYCQYALRKRMEFAITYLDIDP